MARVKKVYGSNVTVVGRSKRRQSEPEPMDPEIAQKLAIAQAVLARGEIHGPDRLDELALDQARIEKLKLECRPNPGERCG